MEKIFATLFILTGFFAIIGGLYTWGDGSIFEQSELIKVLIPWADIILTGPLSLLCGFGILKGRSWGPALGLVTAGIYILGSILVFITIIWKHDYSVFLIVPACSGFAIGVWFVRWMLKRPPNTTNPPILQ